MRCLGTELSQFLMVFLRPDRTHTYIVKKNVKSQVIRPYVIAFYTARFFRHIKLSVG